MIAEKKIEKRAVEVASSIPLCEIKWRIDIAEKIESYGVASWWKRVLEAKTLSSSRGAKGSPKRA